MSDLVNVPAGTTSAGITNFEHWDLIPIKNMVQHSKPGRLKDVAAHWMQVKTELEGAAQELQAATQHITAHWEGSAAQGFVERSSVLQQSIVNTGAHAENTSHALVYASTALDAAKTEMNSIHVPGTMEKAKDKVSDLGHRDDTQFRADVAAGMDRDAAVAKNAGSLSVTEERHQQAIAVMERLAPQYKAASAAMETPPKGDLHDPRRPIPAPPRKITSPGQVGPTPTGPGQSGSTTKPGTRQVGTNPTYRDPGTPGGTDQIHNGGGSTNPTHGGTVTTGTKPPSYSDPYVPNGPSHTGLDGTGGGPTTPTQQPPNGLGSGGGGGSSGTGYGGGGSVGGGFGSGGGYLGGSGYGGSGSGTSSTGGRTGGGAYGGGTAGGRAGGSAAEGAGQGRAGAGGMGGAAGLGGAGRGGLVSRGASSGLARRAGGAVGGAGRRTGGSFTEGGSGLGRNRGSGAGNGRGGGMMPGGAAGQKKKDKKGGSRPDYLVEDEDTWTNGGGPANPPVIE